MVATTTRHNKFWGEATPVVAAGMSIVREWARAETLKRALEAQLREIKAEQREREIEVLEYLAHEGIDRVSIAEGTVYHQSQLWASLSDNRDAAHAAMKRAGLGDMVKETVNSQTLSSWVREVGEENIPASVAPHIKVSESHRVRMRKK